MSLGNLTIGFIGGGAMAEAMIAGLVRADVRTIHVAEPRAARRKELVERFGVVASADNKDVARRAEVLVIAVKPQQLAKALAGLGAALAPEATVLSIVAGAPIARVSELLGGHEAIVRAMPNTPALIGKGIAALFTKAGEPHKSRAEAVMRATGEVVWVDEEETMHAITAVSGSGPAYLFLLAEVMLSAAKRLDLDEALAQKLVFHTLEGAAAMLMATGKAPSELRAQVTSPGGTTEAALNLMFERGVPEAIRQAIAAAAKRSRELGKKA